MQTNPLLKKGLVVGIIVLLGVNFAPLVSSSSSGKAIVNEKLNPASRSGARDFITLNGTMGENGWYVSGVWVTINLDTFWVGAFYELDFNPLTNYTGPFYVGNDGFHYLIFYLIDCYGNVNGPLIYQFGIDQTPPTIVNFTANRVGIFKWKFTADVYDVTSGINRVEFFVDSKYIGNCTEPPYSIFWRGLYFLLKLKFFLYADWDVFPKCDVYDNAGNVYYMNIPSK